MPQQHVLAIEAVPVVQVPLLPRLAAQAAPHDAVADPELARQRRPRRRVTERIGRVEHVESSAPPLRVGRAQQQIAHQRFARRDLLVGEHVPRTHLQPARLHERAHVALALGPGSQVVLEQHGLAVEQEAAVAGVGVQALEQLIHHCDEARLKRGRRQIPLAVPVRVGNQMKDESGHRAAKPKGLTLLARAAIFPPCSNASCSCYRRSRAPRATDSVALADSGAELFPAGIALLRRQGLVAVVGNLSDSVYLLDAATLQRRGTVAVGHRPYTVVADSTRLYVSDWGDSTVSVIDLTAYPPIRLSAWFVGPHPSALALRGGELFVALAGSNGVARVDLATGQVREQLTVALAPHAPVGSDPNALALSPDGRTLYVAMAGNNAVAAVHLSPATMQVAGLIPVGWYPTAVAVAADGKTLFVANGKGAGSHANPDGSYIANLITGSVSIIPAPDRATLARYTREVYALSPYSNARIRPTVRASDRPTEVKQVVYIIRENRTYDQVFGDVSEGNGDPSLAIFNDSITPNAHAIARRWVLFDNFYVDGAVSADGHEWSDRAFANDYNEKTWPQNYSHRRPWDFDKGEDFVTPDGAYLWDAARRKELWVVNFGERAETNVDSGRTSVTRSELSGLRDITVPEYPAFVLAIPDTVRARLFADSVDSWDRQGRFPSLVIMALPRDHTREIGRAHV